MQGGGSEPAVDAVLGYSEFRGKLRYRLPVQKFTVQLQRKRFPHFHRPSR
jgi:hypothetical protein